MLFEDLETFVKEATGLNEIDEEIQQADSASDELVNKLAESIKDQEIDLNSRLGVAKLLMAVDILSS